MFSIDDDILRRAISEVFSQRSSDVNVILWELSEIYKQGPGGLRTLNHAAEMLQAVAYRFPVENIRAVKAAILFHGAAHETKPSEGCIGLSNADRSADILVKKLKKYQAPSDFVENAIALIHAMQNRFISPDDKNYEDAYLLMDLDRIFLSDSSGYLSTAQLIARAAVPLIGAEQYQNIRQDFLEATIASKQIYQTPALLHLESKVRENMSRELRVLNHIVEWARPSLQI